MSEKFTPGPWILKTDLFAGGISIVGQDGFEIYHDHIGPSVSEVTRNTILANAHLMAASKDMYEALKEAFGLKCPHSWCRTNSRQVNHGYCSTHQRIYNALTKADGKEAPR